MTIVCTLAFFAAAVQNARGSGLVRGAADATGKKVYEITPEGKRWLNFIRDLLDEIVDRVRETVRDFTGGAIGELQGEFARSGIPRHFGIWFPPSSLCRRDPEARR